MIVAEFDGRIVHITHNFVQDNGQTVYSFAGRILPEFQRRGIFSTYITVVWRKLLHQPYLPNLRRVRALTDVAHPASVKILQSAGFRRVFSFHVGLYVFDSNSPTEQVIGALDVGSRVQRLASPSDGNLTSESVDQLQVVHSALIPCGVLFVDTFVYSATTANLSKLMKQCHVYGSFDGHYALSALSYGGTSCRGDKSTWWCTISAIDSDKIEDVVKVNCMSALKFAERSESRPPSLVCYFTDIATKHAAEAILADTGFQVIDSFPSYRKLSCIILYEACFV
jgi:hypothetical protein